MQPYLGNSIEGSAWPKVLNCIRKHFAATVGCCLCMRGTSGSGGRWAQVIHLLQKLIPPDQLLALWLNSRELAIFRKVGPNSSPPAGLQLSAEKETAAEIASYSRLPQGLVWLNICSRGVESLPGYCVAFCRQVLGTLFEQLSIEQCLLTLMNMCIFILLFCNICQ